MASTPSTLTDSRPLLVAPVDAAAYLSIGRTRVFELMAAGKLESVKIGKSRRIPMDALERFVAELREGAGDASV